MFGCLLKQKHPYYLENYNSTQSLYNKTLKLPNIKFKITQQVNNQENVAYSQGKRQSTHMNPMKIQMLELSGKNFKVATISMHHEVKGKTLQMYKKEGNIS